MILNTDVLIQYVYMSMRVGVGAF